MTRAASSLALTALAFVLLLGMMYLAGLESAPAHVGASLLRDRCVCEIEAHARSEALLEAGALTSLYPCDGARVDVLNGDSVVVRVSWFDWAALTFREVSWRVELSAARARPPDPVCQQLLSTAPPADAVDL